MNYIISPAWFYMLQLATGAKVLFLVFFAISFVAVICFFAAYITNVDMCGLDDNDTKRYGKYLKRAIIASVIFSIIGVIIPGKNTLIEMQIAKYATVENANWTLETIKSAVDYVVEAIKSLK